MNLTEWLKLCREVTEAHWKKADRRWTIHEQICHTHSEVTEVYDAIRSGNDLSVKYEIADVIYAAITLAHVADLTDKEILYALQVVLKKIQRRTDILSSCGRGAKN